jgi:cysteine-rich repeat protein
VLDLASLAGQSVRFRFRIGSDSCCDDYGWFIDDVRIYTCACGNGDVDAGEDCDDGNGVDCDGCDNDCTDSATCGNGTRCGSEDCDDGNTAAGDCCSASCEYEASGADCDDGEACTLDDTCDGSGVCVGGDPSDDVCDDDNLCSMETCDAAVGCVYTPADCDDGDVCSQDTCDPATGCANMTVPRSGCRMPEKTMLKIRLTTDGIKDKLDWTWKKGGKTLLGSLGDPIDSTDYAMCLYSLPDEEVLFSAAIPGGGTCDDDPCWSAIGTTINQFRYRDPAAATDGFTKIQLKTGAEGRASVTVKAQGVALPDVSLPVTMPITMQLVNDDGECWEATYTSEPRANDAERLSVQER